MSPRPRSEPELFALLAEFDSPEAAVAAARETREAGYRRFEAYTPYPIEELWEAVGHHRSRMPMIVLVGGIIGCFAGYFLQYWVNLHAYPLNVGGRPLHSWPAFIPVTFEMTILIAALFAVLGMFALNGLPMPYHPMFNVERFAEASRDRYFLAIAADDPKFDRRETEEFLQGLGPVEVSEVVP